MNKIVLIVLASVLLFVPLEDYVYYGYGVLILATPVFWLIALVGRYRSHRLVLIDLLPALFLLSWLYGVILGVYRDNSWDALIRNFAGMTFFSFYYMLVRARYNAASLVRAVLWIAAVNIAFGMASAALALLGGAVSASAVDVLSGNSRVLFGAHFSITFCLLAISVFVSLGTLRSWEQELSSGRVLTWLVRSDLAFYIASVHYVLIPFGKGFIINFGILLAAAPVIHVFVTRSPIRWPYLRRAISVIVLLIAIGSQLKSSQGVSSAIDNFRLDSASNATRLEQSEALRDEFSLFGSGLGASLKSGYERDIRGYGFEQSYENVIHKLGYVIGGGVLCMYIVILALAYRAFARDPCVSNCFGLAGAFCFIIPSAGNPMLYATVHVVLLVIAMYCSSGRGDFRSIPKQETRLLSTAIKQRRASSA